MELINMFQIFFEQLYNIREVNQAFQKVCLNKMLLEGYCDMSMYIFGRIRKEDMLTKLITCKSPYATLYRNAYPKEDNAIALWRKYFNSNTNNYQNENCEIELNNDEAIAIVNWVFRAFNNSNEREQFTKTIFKRVKDLYEIRNNIKFIRGVVYNEKKVDVRFISSISAMNSMIASCKSDGKQLFFRGHANSNYLLLPSLMRSKRWKIHEQDMNNELIINCPADFEKCYTHLEKLVKMQHYGLPTRLLDITRNPLVALYFACENEYDCYGEILLIAVDAKNIKYPQSDVVTVLASLPQFSFDKQMEFYNLASDSTVNNKTFNQRVSRLIHEIRLEKPAFQAEIIKEDLLRSVIVYALKNNNRIVKQDGAFILCGLLEEDNSSLNQFRFKEKGKTVVLLVDKKERMLKQLDTFSINRATLFPEIECVSEYIKNKF